MVYCCYYGRKINPDLIAQEHYYFGSEKLYWAFRLTLKITPMDGGYKQKSKVKEGCWFEVDCQERRKVRTFIHQLLASDI